jgi:hypothetical protein
VASAALHLNFKVMADTNMTDSGYSWELQKGKKVITLWACNSAGEKVNGFNIPVKDIPYLTAHMHEALTGSCDVQMILSLGIDEVDKMTLAFLDKNVCPTYRDIDGRLKEHLYSIGEAIESESLKKAAPIVRLQIAAISKQCNRIGAAYVRFVSMGGGGL